MPPIELSQEQVNNLARPLVGMAQNIADFFNNPQNAQAYQEWYLKKYGYYPKDKVKV